MGSDEKENAGRYSDSPLGMRLNDLISVRIPGRKEKAPEDFAKYFQMLGEMTELCGMKSRNFMFSPASLYSTLRAASYGADGNTREEIVNLIGEKEYDLQSEAVNIWNYFVVNHKKDRKTEIRKEYAELLETNQTLRATAYELTDDNCSCLVDEINKRCEEETNGQITKTVRSEDFRDISPMDRFTAFLGNVLHFKGIWNGNCSLKKDFQFIGKDMEKRLVDAVSMSPGGLKYYNNDAVEAFCAPYKEDDGRYTFWGFLPRNMGKRNASKLDLFALEEPEDDYELYVKIPKFRFQSSMNMMEFLKRFGVRDAFVRWKADFTRGFIFPANANVYLNRVKQQTVIDFNEKGTEASASTGLICYLDMCMEEEIHLNFDHPFYFMIWDGKEEVPLFVGQVFSV